MGTGGDGVGVGGELESTVYLDVILSLGGDGDGLFVFKGEGFGELYRHVVGVLLPERGEHGAALGAAVVEDVAEPDFEVAGIPDPGGFIL